MIDNEKLTFNTEKFTFELPAEVDANDIVDLLCTAFDGDMVAAWSPHAETVLPDGFDIYKIPWLKDPSSWAETRKCYIAPLVEGGRVILCDFEDDNKKYVLDLAAIQRGVVIMSTKFKRHWNDFRNENDDAVTGDVFVQCCVFGDVIYG